MFIIKYKLLRVKVFVHLFQKVAESEAEPQGLDLCRVRDLSPENLINISKSVD